MLIPTDWHKQSMDKNQFRHLEMVHPHCRDTFWLQFLMKITTLKSAQKNSQRKISLWSAFLQAIYVIFSWTLLAHWIGIITLGLWWCEQNDTLCQPWGVNFCINTHSRQSAINQGAQKSHHTSRTVSATIGPYQFHVTHSNQYTMPHLYFPHKF